MSMSEYEQRVLEGTPEKCLVFLRAVSMKVEIRAALMEAGYSEQEQSDGWQLLLDASGYVPATLPRQDDRQTRAAIAELDAWDEPAFRRIGAALGRLHPEQSEFVFNGLSAARGSGSLLAIATLLDRLDALGSGEGRPAAMREADAAALATLEQRGLGESVRAHVRALLATAQRAAAPAPVPAEPMSPEREQALRALRAWYLDWSETARAVIQRRDYRVMLGLSKRRSGSRTVDGGAEEDASPATSPTDATNATHAAGAEATVGG